MERLTLQNVTELLLASIDASVVDREKEKNGVPILDEEVQRCCLLGSSILRWKKGREDERALEEM